MEKTPDTRPDSKQLPLRNKKTVKTENPIHYSIWSFLLAAIVSPTTPPALASSNKEIALQVDTIIIKGTRIQDEQAKLPVAVGTVGKTEIQEGRQLLRLDESLVTIPGLLFQNRYNFAQDMRISIRGFGARANFWIRGIRALADGIPQTLPDGQSSIDAIDLG